MRLLRNLTILYVLVLVPTLAASLIAILVYLRRIAGALNEVRVDLAAAQEATKPLGPPIEAVQDVAVQVAARMQEAQTSLQGAHETLAALQERLSPVGTRS